MVSGDAWSASVSISFDLLMSQFWQKRQARLQPAVPNDSTAVPGRKWFNGFFSIGSTQNPLERPYVVSTTWSFSRARTKHTPRWPSRSLHARGQRSHWIRPSSSSCQYTVGTVEGTVELFTLPDDTRPPRLRFRTPAASSPCVERARSFSSSMHSLHGTSQAVLRLGGDSGGR